jgi:hypothetical protein
VLRGIEGAFVAEALRSADGCVTQAARLLGLSYGQLAYRLRPRPDLEKESTEQ